MSETAVIESIDEQGLPERYLHPLIVLDDCHRRIEKFLSYCLSLCECGEKSLDADQNIGLTKALDYFIGASKLHNADEEDSLFPRMRAHEQNEMHEVLDTIDELEAEHRDVAKIHAEHDALGRAWLVQGSLNDNDFKRFHKLNYELIDIYSVHISREDNEVFVAAARVLSDNDLREIGVEMWERRGRKRCRTRIDSRKEKRQSS